MRIFCTCQYGLKKSVYGSSIICPSLRKGMIPYLVETDDRSTENLKIKGCTKGIQWLSD